MENSQIALVSIAVIIILCCIYFMMSGGKNEKEIKEIKKKREENDKMEKVMNKDYYEIGNKKSKLFEHKYNDGNKTTLRYWTLEKDKKHGIESNSYTIFKERHAILFVHGFNDYFFNYKLILEFLSFGYDVYAITLRRYGSTIKKDDDKLFYTNDLNEYIEDIDNCFPKILEGNYKNIFLVGHSTGGLTSTLYCHNGKYKDKIKGLILNSPFFDLNDSALMEFILKYIIYYIGVIYPTFKLASSNDDYYNTTNEETLKRFYFNPKYKLRGSSSIYAGWIKTIVYNQSLIQNKKINLKIPILVLYSDKTIPIDKMEKGDNILDVKEINKYSDFIGKNVTEYSIKNATHDVFVSEEEPREKAIQLFFEFLVKNSDKLDVSYGSYNDDIDNNYSSQNISSTNTPIPSNIPENIISTNKPDSNTPVPSNMPIISKNGSDINTPAPSNSYQNTFSTNKPSSNILSTDSPTNN